MTIIEWLKSLFINTAVKHKAEEAAEEVRQIVSEGAEEVKEKLSSKAAKLREKAKKRARDRYGRFIPDDPNTPDNEAYVDKD